MGKETSGIGGRLPGGYSKLFAAGLVNGIGDRFSSVAMLALVLQMTGSGMAVGISLGVRVLPYLFMAPLGECWQPGCRVRLL